MPFKSQAQRAKFHMLVREGKMSQEVLDHWEAATPAGIKLPKRLHPKKKKGKNMKKIAFVTGLHKTAGLADSLKKVGPKNLEYAGLGLLGAIPAHEVYEGVQKKDKKQVVKGAVDAAGLGTLALATHFAHK